MSAELLSKLRPLQNTAIFASPADFKEWAEQVTSLLSFDSSIQHDFKTSVLAASIVTEMRMDGYEQHTNKAIGVLNQAIASLEVNPVENATQTPSSKTSENKVEFLSIPNGSALTRIAFEVFAFIMGLCAVYLIRQHLGILL